jgi:bis(5'-adenosyl)-triphosphatase
MATPIESTEKDCLFCRNEIAENSFYANEDFVAFYNIAPVLPGHSLVIPRNHYNSLLELPDEKLGEMMIFARKVTRVLTSVFKSTGFDWTIQDGETAGQTVPHLHLHIIPRQANDLPEGEEWYSKIHENEIQILDSQSREKLNELEYSTITKMLKEALATIL